MAKSRFEYVKGYELPDSVLPNTHIVVRVDGRGFHKFSDAHNFEKPNDVRALDLMNRAARAVLDEFSDCVLAFGQSDEYSFLIRRGTNLYSRRESKINSAVCSMFTSAYVFYWPTYMPNTPLLYPPTFDSRVVPYPGVKEVRDYFSWRQADTHINNLYNTCFWALVLDGVGRREANKILQGTDSKDKNEMLFSRFNINYNTVPAYFRKGSVLVRVDPALASLPNCHDNNGLLQPPQLEDGPGHVVESKKPFDPPQSSVETTPSQTPPILTPTPIPAPTPTRPPKRPKAYEGTAGEIVVLHEDIIRDSFWNARPWLLA